eukprot:6625974-Prymnesium_polylepis.1
MLAHRLQGRGGRLTTEAIFVSRTASCGSRLALLQSTTHRRAAPASTSSSSPSGGEGYDPPHPSSAHATLQPSTTRVGRLARLATSRCQRSNIGRQRP